MYHLFEKIKKCQSDLIAWSRQTFGNARTMLDAKHGELAALRVWAECGENKWGEKGDKETLTT